MAIISKSQLIVMGVASASEWSKDQWAERLKAMAERMDENMKLRVPDEQSFVAMLSTPANLAYAPFVNDDFYSRSGLNADQIKAGHDEKMSEAYNKFKTKWDFMFAEVDGEKAKRFKELVDMAKENWSDGVAKYTLPFTGSRRYYRGIGPLAGMWLTDDPKTEGYMRAGDEILIGGPRRICTEANKPSLRTLLNQRLIQSGAGLVKQNWNQDAIDAENDSINALVDGFRDPALNIAPFATTAAESHINWILINEQPYLEIQVGVTP